MCAGFGVIGVVLRWLWRIWGVVEDVSAYVKSVVVGRSVGVVS